ncbi:hypothetical protein JW851_04635 [Candidatus Woesearchaeota archaeon]|nr:hypothetical protein [Candidatus Woesearchaeota archaeon]
MKKEGISIVAIIFAFCIALFFLKQVCIAIIGPLLIITILLLIIAISLSLFKPEYCLYAWIGFGILLTLTIAVGLCISFLGSNELAKTFVDVGNESYQAINIVKDAEKTAQELQKNITKDVIDSLVGATNPDDPTMKQVGEVSKKAIDLT